MKILFLVAYSELAASSRTRVYDFFPFFEKEKIDFKYVCFIPKWLHKFSSSSKKAHKAIYYFSVVALKPVKIFQALVLSCFYDIVFVQKITFSLNIEKILKLFNKKIIFDFDDAIFTGEGKKDNFFKKITSYLRESSFNNMVGVAKCCIVENEYNRKIALKYCPWVEIVTGPIDTEKYFVRQEKKEGPVVVGWTGSSSTTRYLYEITGALASVYKKYNVILKFVGAKSDFKIQDVNCQIEKWDLNKEVSQIQSFDIGIMPLPDNEWTRGKGGYKLLQYMAAGVPAVASPVEINKKIINNGVDGFLADSKDEWVKTLSSLIENEELRKKMGQAGRKKMEESYSLKRAAEKLLGIFKKVAAD